MNDLFLDITTLKAKVEYILEKYPETRNSDAELTTRIVSQFGGDPLKIIQTASRWRRKLNEDGKFLPTIWEVAKQRQINEDVWKEALGYKGKLF